MSPSLALARSALINGQLITESNSARPSPLRSPSTTRSGSPVNDPAGLRDANHQRERLVRQPRHQRQRIGRGAINPLGVINHTTAAAPRQLPKAD
jgi:hypothetical protein